MRLFISYALDDVLRIKPVVELLQVAGHDLCSDHANSRFTRRNQIRQCDAFVYMLTPQSAESEACQWELQQAVNLGRPVALVLLTPRTILPPLLEGLPYADFSQGLKPRAIASLMGDLSRLLVDLPAPV
jgi:hypothetical protein